MMVQVYPIHLTYLQWGQDLVLQICHMNWMELYHYQVVVVLLLVRYQSRGSLTTMSLLEVSALNCIDDIVYYGQWWPCGTELKLGIMATSRYGKSSSLRLLLYDEKLSQNWFKHVLIKFELCDTRWSESIAGNMIWGILEPLFVRFCSRIPLTIMPLLVRYWHRELYSSLLTLDWNLTLFSPRFSSLRLHMIWLQEFQHVHHTLLLLDLDLKNLP